MMVLVNVYKKQSNKSPSNRNYDWKLHDTDSGFHWICWGNTKFSRELGTYYRFRCPGSLHHHVNCKYLPCKINKSLSSICHICSTCAPSLCWEMIRKANIYIYIYIYHVSLWFSTLKVDACAPLPSVWLSICHPVYQTATIPNALRV